MEKTRLLTFRVQPQLVTRLKQVSIERDLPQSWLIRRALEIYLQCENNKPATASTFQGETVNGFVNGASFGANQKDEPL